MLIGVPKEIKNHEYRVGLTPAVVRELKANGHSIIVENDCGAGIGLANDQYVSAGAEVVNSVLLYTSPSPRDRTRQRMPSSA